MRMFQSTPPVSGRRCSVLLSKRPGPSGFNPRPPFPGGDARPESQGWLRQGSFNPRPPFPGGDARAHDEPESAERCFNPRPPFPGGDACWLHGRPSQVHGFNPRPPFPGGDARHIACDSEYPEVSIHAPRFREAMPASGKRYSARSKFQSTPPVSGRRCPRSRRRPAWRFPSFNPRPPFPGGDAHAANPQIGAVE